MNMQRTQRRSLVVVGSMICQFCVGMLYSWSVFQTPIAQLQGWDPGAVSLTFSISTFMLPVAMIAAGVLLPRWGPRRVAALGGVVLTIGLLIASQAHSLGILYLGFGFLGGAGVGMVYGVPIATCAGWYPESTGLITGLAVAGFGLGSSVYAPIATRLIGLIGPMHTFLVQACVSLAGITLGSMLLKAPPAREQSVQDGEVRTRGFTPREMLSTWQYWLLLVIYILANAIGLMVVGHAAPMGQQLAQITAAQASAVVSILAIANTLGRFLGGAMSDRFGPFRVVIFLFLVDAATMFSLRMMTNFVGYALVIAILACCFGGMVGAYPSIVMDYFGPEFYSINYGLVFLAFGIGGLLGPQIVSQVLRTQNGDYTLAFWIAGAAAIAGAVMALFCRKPVQREARGTRSPSKI